MEWNGLFAQFYLCEVDLISVTSFRALLNMSARGGVTFSERRRALFLKSPENFAGPKSHS